MKKKVTLVALVLALALGIGCISVALALVINAANKTTGTLTVDGVITANWTAATANTGTTDAVKNGDVYTTTMSIDRGGRTDLTLVLTPEAGGGLTAMSSGEYTLQVSFDGGTTYSNYSSGGATVGSANSVTVKVTIGTLSTTENKALRIKAALTAPSDE